MAGFKCEVKEGELHVVIPIEKAPSKSGKTMVVATTHGNVLTSAVHDGKPLTVGLTAYYKP
jgi:hypothetical protein